MSRDQAGDSSARSTKAGVEAQSRVRGLERWFPQASMRGCGGGSVGVVARITLTCGLFAAKSSAAATAETEGRSDAGGGGTGQVRQVPRTSNVTCGGAQSWTRVRRVRRSREDFGTVGPDRSGGWWARGKECDDRENQLIRRRIGKLVKKARGKALERTSRREGLGKMMMTARGRRQEYLAGLCSSKAGARIDLHLATGWGTCCGGPSGAAFQKEEMLTGPWVFGGAGFGSLSSVRDGQSGEAGSCSTPIPRDSKCNQEVSSMDVP